MIGWLHNWRHLIRRQPRGNLILCYSSVKQKTVIWLAINSIDKTDIGKWFKWLHSFSLVNQTLRPFLQDDAYQSEITSAPSERVWCNAYTFSVQGLPNIGDCWLVFNSYTRGIYQYEHHRNHANWATTMPDFHHCKS